LRLPNVNNYNHSSLAKHTAAGDVTDNAKYVHLTEIAMLLIAH